MSVDKTVDAIRNFSTNPEEVARTTLKEISGASEYEGCLQRCVKTQIQTS